MKKLKLKLKRHLDKKARRGQRPKKKCVEILGSGGRKRWRIK